MLDPQSLPAAIKDFRQARQKALLQKIIGKLTGKSVDLLSYDEVASQLRITGRHKLGIHQIPLEAIVGSVGRYNDFTRSFLPHKKSDLERWAGVRTAAADMSQLPPIEVYQIDTAYFVLDGNHRVSIARRQGLSYIDAEVTEVRTRVPLSPDDQPDELILKAEYAAFLESTRLDQLRPEADLLVSVPGQYAHLENHIEVHRYLTETANNRELSDEEAVCLWYDEAYFPMVEAIREQGILRYFPGRTETDFYVWLATHRAELQHELGWQIESEAAVSKLTSRVRREQEHRSAGISHRILDSVLPDRWLHEPERSWSQGRLLARYSDRLFADILVAFGGDAESWSALEQALVIAGREGSRLHGLNLTSTDISPESQELLRVQETFAKYLQQAQIDGELTEDTAHPTDVICRRVLLADLVIVDPMLFSSGVDQVQPDPQLVELIERLARPALLVPGSKVPLERILLAYDGSAKAKEALFVSTYLAERWQADLAVIAVQESRRVNEETLSHAREYLEMHEVEATFSYEDGEVTERLLRKAREGNRDLIVMGAHEAGRFGRASDGGTMAQLLANSVRPILICP